MHIIQPGTLTMVTAATASLALSSVTSLTAAISGCNALILSAVNQDILVRMDGTAPTAAAYAFRVLADADEKVLSFGPGAIPAANIKILEGASGGTLCITPANIRP